MKKHVSVKNLFIRIFFLKCYESIRENERKRGKHIQDAERLAEELRKYPYLYEIGNKRYEEIHRKKSFESSWTVSNSILMDNKGPSHTLKGCTFFFINFAKTFIIQITWNAILYHWHLSPAINYGKLLVLFFFWMFPKPASFSFFFWFVPNGNNNTTRP